MNFLIILAITVIPAFVLYMDKRFSKRPWFDPVIVSLLLILSALLSIYYYFKSNESVYLTASIALCASFLCLFFVFAKINR